MSEKSEKKSGGCLKGFFWLFVIVILMGTGGYFYLSKKMDLTKEAIFALFEGFKPKQVINTFSEWRDLQIEGNEGNILEVATATSTEEFSRETNFEMFGKILPISTLSKIDVPATYRYHIDLTGEWVMEADQNRLIVTPPPLQPSLPIAYDSAKMKKTNPEGWSKFLASSNMSELEKSITASLEERARDPLTIRKVEEEARTSIAKFLQSWLTSKEEWKEGHFEEIVVCFEGEEPDHVHDPSKVPDLRIADPETVLP